MFVCVFYYDVMYMTSFRFHLLCYIALKFHFVDVTFIYCIQCCVAIHDR